MAINRTKSITEEGAIALASSILISAHDDYLYALCFIEKNKERYNNEIKDKVLKYLERKDQLKIKKRLDKKIKSGKELKLSDKLIYKVIKKQLRQKIKYPTKSELNFYEKYNHALREKRTNESFYKSKWFEILTLGGSIPGKEVIEYIRNEAESINYEYDSRE